MKKEVIDAINQDIEAALTDVTDMETILGEEASEEKIKEKFKMLSEKVTSLESLLIKEGIL
ncbi:hypothetical protein [Proteiniclasticum sp.]|uniref:hypothetical protein n=1 Tax=Proteiniclasticum sp. TaxID=2053595 RepID=UPI000EEE649E|nr:hypothetical protein [Proteiniclasticum sp.]HCW74108.1 hypothetical protein [Clostridiaceae bacterium]